MRDEDSLEALTNDEVLAVQRGRAAFLADVGRVVGTIAERHRAAGALLTWQLVRDILEEALADIGLAARWPVALLEEVAAAAAVPPLDGCLTDSDMSTLSDVGRPIVITFRRARPG